MVKSYAILKEIISLYLPDSMKKFVEIEVEEKTPTMRLQKFKFIKVIEQIIKNACEALDTTEPDNREIKIEVSCEHLLI